MRGTIEAGGRVRLSWGWPLAVSALTKHVTVSPPCTPSSAMYWRVTEKRVAHLEWMTHNNIFLVKKRPRLVSGFCIPIKACVSCARHKCVPLPSSTLCGFSTGLTCKLYNFVENLAQDLKLCCAQYLKLPSRTFTSALKCNGQLNTRPRKSLLKLLCQRWISTNLQLSMHNCIFNAPYLQLKLKLQGQLFNAKIN